MCFLKNKYISLELNDRNEIRADVGITIKSLNLVGLVGINVKIDTGCPYTSIPFRRLGQSEKLASYLKQQDCLNPQIKKEISFGVNDSKKDKLQANQDLKNGNYCALKQITFQHSGFEIDFDGVAIKQNTVKISYDRIGNILIGMDILSKLDVHIAKSRITGKTTFLACPLNNITDEYLEALEREFGIGTSVSSAICRNSI